MERIQIYRSGFFQKGKATYNDVEIHENLIVKGPIGNLDGHTWSIIRKDGLSIISGNSLYIFPWQRESGPSPSADGSLVASTPESFGDVYQEILPEARFQRWHTRG